MKSDHLINLSNALFEELLKQFEILYALLRCSVDAVVERIPETQFTNNEFITLLRCCLMMLQFLEFDTSILWEKCGVLLRILDKVCPPSLMLDSHDCSTVTTKNSFSQCCSYFFEGINKESDRLLNLFSMIIEVFVAEFSENVALRKHLFLVYILTPNSEKLCSCRNTHTDNCIVLELVSSHFLLSVKNGLGFSRFLHLLSGSRDFGKMTPEISVDASLKLISTPFILSAPCILQAHLILLASRCISTHLPIDGRKSACLRMTCYINPFELSVKLYLSYLSTLQLDDAILGVNVRSNFGVTEPLSASIVHRMTWDKVTHQLDDLVDFSHLQSEGTFFGTNSELLGYSAAYMQGNHPLIDQLCKEATCLVVDYMVENILSRKLREQGQNENKRLPHEVYCLAAAMNLMNSSLLHIIWHSTQTGFHDEMKTLRDTPPCVVYECLSQSASILRVSGCGAEQQVQKFLSDMFGTYGGMHLEIKFILAHISSLLVFSFRRKLDFLWKGCISMMMTLTSLLLFEERNLGVSKIFKLLQSHPRMDDKDLTYRSTSVMIAANLEKTRMLYLKHGHNYGHVVENRTNAGESREGKHQSEICGVDGTQDNTCNGERFTRCIPSFHTNPSEWVDLVDFIECSPEKDYFSWLNNRNKFVKWKQEKAALLKCQKRKRTFGIVKEYNLRARIGARKSNAEAKSQEQQSRITGEEWIKDRGVRETKGQVSSTDHADPSELKGFVKPIDCRPEKEKQGKAELLKEKKQKRRTFVIVKEYNLRARINTGKRST